MASHHPKAAFKPGKVARVHQPKYAPSAPPPVSLTRRLLAGGRGPAWTQTIYWLVPIAVDTEGTDLGDDSSTTLVGVTRLWITRDAVSLEPIGVRIHHFYELFVPAHPDEAQDLLTVADELNIEIH